jgi:hypothetical protein
VQFSWAANAPQSYDRERYGTLVQMSSSHIRFAIHLTLMNMYRLAQALTRLFTMHSWTRAALMYNDDNDVRLEFGSAYYTLVRVLYCLELANEIRKSFKDAGIVISHEEDVLGYGPTVNESVSFINDISSKARSLCS